MPDSTTAKSSGAGGSDRLWPSTIWSLIRQGREGDAGNRREARDSLCRLYYGPVLRFFQKVLRVEPDHLDDLTQDFFTRFIEKDFLRNVAAEKSFRSYLKVACRHHFIDWIRSRKSSHLKVALAEAVEAPAPETTLERIESMIDEEMRRWTLDEAVSRLKARLLEQGKELQFQIFEARSGLSPGAPATYRQLSERFGVSVYDIGNHLAAARGMLRQILLEIAADRSDDPAGELRELGLNKFLY